MRSNRLDVDEMVRAALGNYLVEGVEAPPNFSVIIGGEPGHGEVGSGLHFLYRNHMAMVRSRRPGRVLEGLFAYLASHLPSEGTNGLLRVNGVGLVKEGRAVLAPSMITNWTDILSPRLYRSGVQFVDAPGVSVDLDRGEMVVEESGLDVDRRPLAPLKTNGSAGSEPAAVEPGRYPLVSWGFFTGDDRQMGRISPARAIVAAAPSLIQTSGVKPAKVIEGLGRVFSMTAPVSVGSPYRGDLASKLVDLFSA